MTDFRTDTNNHSTKNRSEDIDSKIADFMADIDQIVGGKKMNNQQQQQQQHGESEWKQCFDETSQSIYYWNMKTNECSWDPPLVESSISTSVDDEKKKRQEELPDDMKLVKKLKKPNLIAEYASSDSESSEEDDDKEQENVDDIDELLEEVLDQDEEAPKKNAPLVDLHPSFEAECRAAIARLVYLGDKSADILILRVQLETRLEDTLAGHLSKSYAASKLEEAFLQIKELENLYLTTNPLPTNTEPITKPSLTTSEMALLLSLPPPPPPPSPPPPPIYPQPLISEDDRTLQMFYAQLQSEQNELPPPPPPPSSDIEKPSTVTKSDHHHHHHHKDKKSKPAKTLPTDLIQKWTHARQELRGIADTDDS